MSELFNAADYLVDRHVRAGNGERTAVVCGPERVSYAQLQELSAAFAAGLEAVDLRPGERVLFVCSDGPELLAGLLGSWRHGAIAVPVSTMLTAPELTRIVTDSGARALVATPEFAATASTAARSAPQLRFLVAVGAADLHGAQGARTTGWDELLAAGRPVEPAATTADTPALWLYTSGTTGAPKGAMHRHANIRAVCETYARDVLQITRDDVCFSVAKLFFAYGLGGSALFPLSAGATTVLEPRRPSPAIAAERLRVDRPSLFFAGPTFLAALLAGDLPDDALASVRLCVSAGEALPATLCRRFHERFGVDVLDGIGSTEALHIFLSNRAGQVRPGTSGVPVAGYEIELRDTLGRPVADGEPGGLYVKGESLASGYWCRTEATRAVFLGEWLSTGDTCTRSADGYYTCLGRSDDLLKAGGIWVSPIEVEDRLLQHPDVVEAAVVAVPDRDELDKPVACVVLRPGAQAGPAELVAWCRDGLAAYKRPRAVLVVDALPRTATGKVQRFLLREQALAAAVPVTRSSPDRTTPVV